MATLQFDREDFTEISLSRLRVRNPLGRGAFARCWRATYNGKQDVALKVFTKRPAPPTTAGQQKQTEAHDDLYERMFLREAQVTMKLDNRHIIRCFGVLQLPAGFVADQPEPALALVLELCEPYTLKEMISRSMASGKRLYKLSQAYGWLLQIASGLAHLHGQRRPILHRDVKAENILLKRDPDSGGALVCKLADLGLHVEVDLRRSAMLRCTSRSLVTSSMALSTQDGSLGAPFDPAGGASTAEPGNSSRGGLGGYRTSGGTGDGSIRRASRSGAGPAAMGLGQAAAEWEGALAGGDATRSRVSGPRSLLLAQEAMAAAGACGPPSGGAASGGSPFLKISLGASFSGAGQGRTLSTGVALKMMADRGAAGPPSGSHPISGHSTPRRGVSGLPPLPPRTTQQLLQTRPQSSPMAPPAHGPATSAACSTTAAPEPAVSHSPVPAPPRSSAEYHGPYDGSPNPPSEGQAQRSSSAQVPASQESSIPGQPACATPGVFGTRLRSLVDAAQALTAPPALGDDGLSEPDNCDHELRGVAVSVARDAPGVSYVPRLFDASPEQCKRQASLPECPAADDSDSDSGSRQPTPLPPPRLPEGAQLPLPDVSLAPHEHVTEAGPQGVDQPGNDLDSSAIDQMIGRNPDFVEEVRSSDPAAGLRDVASLLQQLGLSELKPLRPNELEWVFGLTGRAGSFMYMAPEVFRNQPYNDKSDVFSFGVLMYEVLVCELLVVAVFNTMRASKLGVRDPQQYAALVANGYRPPRPQKLSEGAWQLISACWHPDPVERPAMEAVVAELERLLSEEGGPTARGGRRAAAAGLGGRAAGSDDRGPASTEMSGDTKGGKAAAGGASGGKKAARVVVTSGGGPSFSGDGYAIGAAAGCRCVIS